MAARRFCSRDCYLTRDTRPIAERFWAKVQKTTGCWFWTGSKHKGYGRIGLTSRRIVEAHRLSWELHNGPITAGLHVLHRCDNPQCTRPDHLFLGTQAENVADMVAKGRHWAQRRAG